MKAKDLRNSILQMAVQGKLVPQAPNDEPASVLLERIRAERRKLIAEKKIKAPKGGESIIFRASDGLHYENTSSNSPSLRSVSPPPSLREDTTSTPSLRGGRFASDEAISSGTWFEQRFDAKGKPLGEPVCIDDEIPFDIPDTWEWSRLDSIEIIETGKRDANHGANGGEYEFFTCSNTPFSCPTYSFDGDCLIMPGNGANVGLVINHRGKFEAYQRTYVASAIIENCYQNFVYYHLLWNWRHYNSGKLYGSATPYIKLANLTEYLVAFPPLAEQERIVQEIEELLPFVDEYGALEDARERLDAELPERLRKSVLQLAVQGKLVPQDPNDEPASVLLDRIRAERKKLIVEKKIKAPKGGESVIFRGSDGCHYENISVFPSSLRGGRFTSDEAISSGTWFEQRFDAKGKPLGEPVCIDDEIPFDIPNTWQWVRLENLVERIHYGYTCSSSQAGTIHLLRITDIQDNSVNWDKVPFCAENPKRLDDYKLNRLDILIARTGGTVGKNYVVRDCPYDSVFASYLIRVVLVKNELASYIDLFMDAPLYWNQLIAASAGTGQPNVNSTALGNLLVPVPPLAEQERIVQSVEEALNLLS